MKAKFRYGIFVYNSHICILSLYYVLIYAIKSLTKLYISWFTFIGSIFLHTLFHVSCKGSGKWNILLFTFCIIAFQAIFLLIVPILTSLKSLSFLYKNPNWRCIYLYFKFINFRYFFFFNKVAWYTNVSRCIHGAFGQGLKCFVISRNDILVTKNSISLLMLVHVYFSLYHR